MTDQKPTAVSSEAFPPPTVSHVFGEMTWLLTQSPLHRALRISDLEWLIMPALIHKQFYLFRDAGKVIGLALWAKCDEIVEKKLKSGAIEPDTRLTLEDWTSGDAVWLVDLIAPFANEENRHREVMIADLISGPLSGQPLNFHRTDPVTGERTAQRLDPDVGDKLKAALKATLKP